MIKWVLIALVGVVVVHAYSHFFVAHATVVDLVVESGIPVLSEGVLVIDPTEYLDCGFLVHNRMPDIIQ